MCSLPKPSPATSSTASTRKTQRPGSPPPANPGRSAHHNPRNNSQVYTTFNEVQAPNESGQPLSLVLPAGGAGPLPRFHLPARLPHLVEERAADAAQHGRDMHVADLAFRAGH